MPLMAHGARADGTIRIAGAHAAGPGLVFGLVVLVKFNRGAVAGLTARCPRCTLDGGGLFRCAVFPGECLLGHMTAALIVKLQFAEAGPFGAGHGAAGQIGVAALKELLHFLGMAAGTGFG